MTSTTTTDTPRIYVASLTDYNAGILHGAWVDATQDPEEIHADILAVLSSSPYAAWYPMGGPAEEYAIHDYDGFGPITSELGEWENIDRLHAIAVLIEEHGAPFLVWFAQAESYETAEADELEDRYQSAYRGTADSEEDYAHQWAEEIGAIHDEDPWPYNHVDWEAATRELFQHGPYSSVYYDGELYIFEDVDG